MTAKWKEISAYTGRPVEEDAPTNFAGAGSSVDMNPTGMAKKKKKISTILASTTSERKVANSFTGGGRGTPMMMPRPHPSSSKQLSIKAFI